MSSAAASVVGPSVYLRPLERADLNERYLGWLNDPEVARYLESRTSPYTMQRLVDFYESVIAAPHNLFSAIIEKQGNQHIGNVKLAPISLVHKRATFGLLIGDKNFWGRGVGTEVTHLTVQYGFNRLNLHRINLGVFADHTSAVRSYEKVGFKIEGRLRESAFHEGTFKDTLLMGLLRSEYRPEKVFGPK